MPQTQAQADWYQRNKDRNKLATKQWKKDHPEKHKKMLKTYYMKHHDKMIKDSKATYIRKSKYNPELLLFHAAKRRAKIRGLEFSIDISDIIIPKFCPALNIPLYKSDTSIQKDNSPTLDRLNNTLGYIKGNVNVISWKANRIKTNATTEEIKKVAIWLESLIE